MKPLGKAPPLSNKRRHNKHKLEPDHTLPVHQEIFGLEIATHQQLLQSMGIHNSPTLPTELWREVLFHVCSIPDEFDISSTANGAISYYTHIIYLYNWRKAMKQRLQVALISKYFHAVATEFLYSSFIILSQSDYNRAVEIVRRPETACHLRRITIEHILPDLAFEDFRHCKGLYMYVDITGSGNDPGKWTGPPILSPNLTHLEVEYFKNCPSLQTWKNMLEILPECRSLRSLRLTWVSGSGIDWPLSARPCTLSQLELLGLAGEIDCHGRSPLLSQWLPSLILPKLNTLILSGDHPGLALLAFGSTISTLSISKCPPHMIPKQKILLPKIRRFIVPYNFPKEGGWERLPDVIQMETIEVVEIHLERSVSKLSGYLAMFWCHEIDMDLRDLLRSFEDPTITPKLKKVDFDLSRGRYSGAGEGFQITLTLWNKIMRFKRPEVEVRTHFWGGEWTSMSLECLNNPPHRLHS